MFKDYDKYLSTSLKVYLFVLVIIFIMKIVGLDYFGLDLTNPTITRINEFLIKYKIIDVWYAFTMYIYAYFIFSLTTKDNSKKMKKYVLCCMIIIMIFQHMKLYINNTTINALMDFTYLFFLICIYERKISFKLFKRYSIIMLVNLIFQIISIVLRNINFNSVEYTNAVHIILNLDYLLLMIITHQLYFKEGGAICSQEVVSLSSLKKINLSNLLKRLQRNYHNFKKLNKEAKLTYAIYFILSLIWNTATLVIILAIASLNDTLIECLFILTSFWLSKRTFGKAFHLPSMIQCFIISNLTYYALNRITTPIGISIIVPILLGVGLSYVTSKLVKKMYKPLYRGMPEDVFEETITKVVEKDSYKYKICYDYFIKKESALKLSYKYNYSEAGIRKIKDRVNIAIKELNK